MTILKIRNNMPIGEENLATLIFIKQILKPYITPSFKALPKQIEAIKRMMQINDFMGASKLFFLLSIHLAVIFIPPRHTFY